MRRLTLTTLGLLGAMAAGPATAADIRVPYKAPPPSYVTTFYNWTGFYIGAHAGYAWADFEGSDTLTGLLTDSVSARGFIYGGQVGFNYQLGSWVFGVEGDFTLGDVRYSEDLLLGLASASVELDRIYTVAGRIGYAFDRTLIYGKFGAAWTREEYNFTVLGASANAAVDRTGWLLGVGVEYAFAGNWSAKIEYNYLDMGSKDVTLVTVGPIAVAPATVDLTVQTVKVGVNYRFGWGRY
jgi:outer membrane immunogenic protein